MIGGGGTVIINGGGTIGGGTVGGGSVGGGSGRVAAQVDHGAVQAGPVAAVADQVQCRQDRALWL